MADLSGKKCVPCDGGTPTLTHDAVTALLQQLPDWTLQDDSAPMQISREFKFKNFKEAVAFVNSVAAVAEENGHHPDIFLHGWNRVRISLSTHAISGLSENDFIMAAKIDTITA